MEIPAYLFFYVAVSAILSLLQQTLADSPPTFRKEPSSEAVKRNSRVKLKCKVDPKDADIRWVFNDEDVTESEELGVSMRKGSLVIQEFTDELHQGTYQCIASNSGGAIISREAYLQVAYIKNFPKTLPERTTSLPGQVTVINCQRPESLPPALMEYYFNGELIVESDHYRIMPSGSLHIIHTSRTDEGVYGCRAVNPVTKRTRDLFNATTLEVLDESSTSQDEAARILIASDTSVEAGHQALLECVARGVPFPTVHWQKQDGTLPRSAVQHSGSLKIPSVSVKDAGVYECVVGNKAGSPVMREILLEVIDLPKITKPPKTVSVGVGGAGEFKCGVTGATDQDISWLHNAQPIPQDNPSYIVQKITDGVQLLVTDVTRTQLGVYQCVVRTNRGMAHAAATLKFRDGFPRITTAPENTTAIEGENVLMLCRASGEPTPVLKWTAPGGRTIVKSRRIMISEDAGSMTIFDVGLTDQGYYRCTASNRLGAVSVDAYLAVIEKITVTPTPLPPSRKTIGKPLSSDDGNMTVENTEEPEKPGAVPNAPGKPDIFKTSETSVEVRWTHTDSGTAPVTKFKIEYRNIRVDPNWLTASTSVDPSNTSYEVRNLSPGGTYRFRVTAANQYGDSAPSEMSHRFFLQASTPTVRPVRPPQGEVRITSSKAIGSSAIEVKWEYTPGVFNTPIDGYYIYHRDTDSDDDRDYIRTPVVGQDVKRYLIDKLEPEVSYDIKMASFNNGGTSGFSNVVIVATPAPETPITFIPGPVIPSPDTVPNNDLGMPKLPEESPNPDTNTSTEGQDILYITLGVVLGAMLLVLIMFGVMCIWRAKQVNNERVTRMECDWRHGPYYDSSYRYMDTNGSSSHCKFHHVNGSMNGGPHHPPNHVYAHGIGHLPFGETATAIDPQPLFPLTPNGIDERTLMSSQPSISNGHGPYTTGTEPIKTVPMLPRTSSEPVRSGFEPARSREGPLHSGSSSEHLQGNGSIRSYNSSSGPDGTTSSRESGRTRSKRPKCPHRHHKADINKAVRRQPNEHPTSREGSIGSSLDCTSVEVSSPPQTPTSATQLAPSPSTLPPPRSDGTDSLHSRSRSSSNLSNASSCRNVKHSDIF